MQKLGVIPESQQQRHQGRTGFDGGGDGGFCLNIPRGLSRGINLPPCLQASPLSSLSPLSPSPTSPPSPHSPPSLPLPAYVAITTIGCKVQRLTPARLVQQFKNKLVVVLGDSRLTPARLVQQFKNKLVVVLGDSVSKNLADSIKCTLHAANPRSIKTFRLASGKTELAGTWIPRYNIRFVSVFSTHLNNATSLEGQPNAQDIKALSQQPESLESVGGRSTDRNGTAEGIARSANTVERIETMANQQSQRIDLDQLDPRVVDLLPLADIIIFQATNWWYSPSNQYYLKNRRVNLTRSNAYAIGLTTLRNYVTRSALAAARGLKGFKGKAVLLGASPSHYNIPVPGVKPGFCEVQEMMTLPQTVDFRRSDVKTNVFREVQRRVLRDSVIRYVDVGPMSDWRPDGHLQNWIVSSGSTKKNDCLHWCEAGVTDAWLEMVHNTLLF
ncbi:unnamed protein product [Closterium sp. NIES-64]|nr:unnamed protein product [Closterium sp. NIES-64]